MACGEAEDADGLTLIKDDNEAVRYFIRRIFECVDYNDPLRW